jgi:hypothetical protein
MTITIMNHGLQPHDSIIMYKPENRWYVRFWYFVTFRKCPMRGFIHKILSVTNTTLEVK